MSDLRVLHVLGKMQPGGIQAFLVSLHRELRQCGIQFDYLLKSDGPDYFDGEITALGGRVYHFPYNGNLPVVAQRKLEFFSRLIATRSFTVILDFCVICPH